MLLAESVQLVEANKIAWVFFCLSRFCPFAQSVVLQIVLIVFKQLLIASLCYAKKFYLHLKRCLTVGKSLCYVLFY